MSNTAQTLFVVYGKVDDDCIEPEVFLTRESAAERMADLYIESLKAHGAIEDGKVMHEVCDDSTIGELCDILDGFADRYEDDEVTTEELREILFIEDYDRLSWCFETANSYEGFYFVLKAVPIKK